MGAWIEIASAVPMGYATFVAPSMGAWIEIRSTAKVSPIRVRRSLYGSVD